MAHWYKSAWYYLWIAPHIFLLPVLVIVYTRRLHKKFPIFFVYACYEIAQFFLLFAIYMFAYSRAALYQYVFIATLAGSAALRFGIVQEVFNNVFQGFPRLESLAATSMRGLTVLLLLAAIITAIYATGPAPDHLLAGIELLDRSAAIIQAGLLFFLFLFARMFGLSIRNFAFGIALGFGLVATTDLAVSALSLVKLDLPLARFLNLLVTASYQVSVLIWLGFLLMAENRRHCPRSSA